MRSTGMSKLGRDVTALSQHSHSMVVQPTKAFEATMLTPRGSGHRVPRSRRACYRRRRRWGSAASEPGRGRGRSTGAGGSWCRTVEPCSSPSWRGRTSGTSLGWRSAFRGRRCTRAGRPRTRDIPRLGSESDSTSATSATRRTRQCASRAKSVTVGGTRASATVATIVKGVWCSTALAQARGFT